MSGDAVVDPRFRVPYYTYILRGLDDLGSRYRYRQLSNPPCDGMTMELGGRRVWVSTDDGAEVPDDIYAWADISAKVNCREDDVARLPKLVPIGPLFGIQLWKGPRAIQQWLRLAARDVSGARSSLAGVRFQSKTRLPIERYAPSEADPSYLFHRSRAWSGKHAGTNDERVRFIAALNEMRITHDCSISDERISLADYMRRTARSSFVFNSPAVHRCLGWKLGEYLAMGKAILSTPLNRALPSPLVHGEHIHFVADDVDAMRDAITTLAGDPGYRRHLEVNARRWYERHMTPAAVVQRLLT